MHELNTLIKVNELLARWSTRNLDMFCRCGRLVGLSDGGCFAVAVVQLGLLSRGRGCFVSCNC
jgi:hypothetical protein